MPGHRVSWGFGALGGFSPGALAGLSRLADTDTVLWILMVSCVPKEVRALHVGRGGVDSVCV